MTIKARLYLSLILLAGALLAIGIAGWSGTTLTAGRTRTIVNDRVLPLEQLKVVADMYAVNIVDTSHKVRSGAMSWEDGARSIDQALATVEARWAEYLSTTLTPEERRLIDDADAVKRAAASSIDTLKRLVAAKDGAGLEAFVERDLYPAIDPIGTGISRLIDHQVAVAKDEYASAESLGTVLAATMACVALLAAAILAFALWTVKRGVVAPLHGMEAAMRQLAGGDLATEVPARDRKDEIGAMAQAVQVFKDGMVRARELQAAEAAEQEAKLRRAERMQRFVGEFDAAVGSIVHAVSSAATEMQATASQLTSSARETTSQSATVSAAAEEAAASVGSVAASAEELGSSVAEIRRQVDRSATMASEAAAEATSTTRVVADLSADAAGISSVVDIIAELAGKTNLLALNATIEAARAGEAGRGFAVVAAEVKGLAAQTSRATTEINQKIEAMQASTERAVGAIELIARKIGALDEATATITAAVEQQSVATQEIAGSASQASVGAHEITSTIHGVARAADETGGAAEQVRQASTELARQAEELRSRVVMFLEDVRAA